MKKIVVSLAVFIFIISLSSCKAGRNMNSKGCGFTSDITTVNKTILTKTV